MFLSIGGKAGNERDGIDIDVDSRCCTVQSETWTTALGSIIRQLVDRKENEKEKKLHS